MNDSLVTSAHGLAAITAREGRILHAYDDGTGTLTIGVGHTSAAGPPHVIKGMTITGAQSDEILANDLKAVENAIHRLVRVPLNQNQFDALVSFVFNVGEGAFASSTMLRMLNDHGDYKGAADQFGKWTKAGGKTLPGLVKRREQERAQFLFVDRDPAPDPVHDPVPEPEPAPVPEPVPVPEPRPEPPEPPEPQPAPKVGWISALISMLVTLFKGERF